MRCSWRARRPQGGDGAGAGRGYKGSAACWYLAREGQWGRKGLQRSESRATAPSSTRARRRHWANPQALAKSREVQGRTRQTVYRIKADPTGAEAALATWGV